MTDPQNNPYQAPQAPLTQETVGGLPLAPVVPAWALRSSTASS